MGRALFLALIAILVVGVLPASAGPSSSRRDLAPQPAPHHDENFSGAAFVEPIAQPLKHPVLTSSLVRVAQSAHQGGRAAALGEAREAGVTVNNDRVRVEILPNGGDERGVQAAVAQAGGTVERSGGGLVQALLPPNGLEQVAGNAAVHAVRPAMRLFPTAVAGEEVPASGATGWQTNGAAGAGVKIAVLDGDFKDYQLRQASSDLPPNLTTINRCSDGFENGIDGGHGTAVAEIVYEMAPGAQLYLVCAATLSEMALAVPDMISAGVQIVNHSRGLFNSSRADGVYNAGDPAYLPESLITTAYNAGILWVNSAGNSAPYHWSGTFQDGDVDGIHNFTATDEGNTFTIPAGGTIYVYLKWDEWPTATSDYDLYLVRQSDGVVLSESVDNQVAGGLAPTEFLQYKNTTGASLTVAVAIAKFRATVTPRIDLFVDGSASALEHNVPAGSLTDFAVSPRAVVAGAACFQSTTIETYSSQGPTINPTVTGVKPDLTGLDSFSSATYGPFSGCPGSGAGAGRTGFTGTSAAAPSVAGAAALVKDFSGATVTTPTQLKAALLGRVTDAGVAGPDAVYGAGILALGTLTLPAATCTTTPRIGLTSSVQGGALVSAVRANGDSNSVLRLLFGTNGKAPSNALLSFPTGASNVTGAGGYTAYTPFGSVQTTFSTARQGAGAVTVPLVAVDRCGTWSTFVGAGTGVGF